jgi:UDP-N-acetylmuramoyl-L-alanyl-D-glutamate--2,6-diaminopimelate ligase
VAEGDVPRGTRSVRVSLIAAAVGGELVGDDPVVTDVTHDSRRVPIGALFVAVVGGRSDGHDHVAAAVDAGAAAVLVSRPLDGISVPQVLVDDTRRAMPIAASTCWGDPSSKLSVVGVTGTNGKTTVVTLVGAVLASLGREVRVIGTLTGARTTPEATDLQAMLAAYVDDGVEAVAMEVSSHALALRRVDGIHFEVAVFTNLGLDHLDFHGTVERYFEAKAALFEPDRSAVAVLNVDSPHGRLLRDAAPDGRPIVEYGLDDAHDLEVTSSGSRFEWRGERVELSLAGRFNVSNALAAAEVCVTLGHAPPEVAAALGSVTAPPGRFELVSAGQPFVVVVDYAHTPDGLEEVLRTARELATERLWVVFGCGGDRDRSKRPRMGEVACRLADVVVITSDNPRSEDPSAIIAAVRSGCALPKPVTEPDRRAAIALAIDGAAEGDVVVLAGKGHETVQEIGSQVLPFDDRVVAADALAARGWGARP